MTALHHLATASPYIAALVVLLVIVSHRRADLGLPARA
jgi:hypothetical protein